MITRKTLLTNFLPWLIVPLILMLVFPTELFYFFIIIGGLVVLFVDYIALQHKRFIPIGLAGLTLAALIGWVI